jgi:hypothetical protein
LAPLCTPAHFPPQVLSENLSHTKRMPMQQHNHVFGTILYVFVVYSNIKWVVVLHEGE